MGSKESRPLNENGSNQGKCRGVPPCKPHRVVYFRGALKMSAYVMGSKTQQGQERTALIAGLLS